MLIHSEMLQYDHNRFQSLVGPGGFLDSQTTDTQFFDFKESQVLTKVSPYGGGESMEVKNSVKYEVSAILLFDSGSCQTIISQVVDLAEVEHGEKTTASHLAGSHDKGKANITGKQLKTFGTDRKLLVIAEEVNIDHTPVKTQSHTLGRADNIGEFAFHSVIAGTAE